MMTLFYVFKFLAFVLIAIPMLRDIARDWRAMNLPRIRARKTVRTIMRLSRSLAG